LFIRKSFRYRFRDASCGSQTLPVSLPAVIVAFFRLDYACRFTFNIEGLMDSQRELDVLFDLTP
jgi:hypothetical protein